MLPTLVLVASLAAGAGAPAPDAPGAREEGAPGAAPDLTALPAGGGRGGIDLGAPAREGRGPPVHLAAPRGLHQEDGSEDDRYDDEDGQRHPHLLVSGWGGEALAHGGSGRASSFYGGEVAWAFSQLDLGIAATWYRSLRDSTRAWTPVVLTRVTQRFLTQRGFEAAFSIGFGAGRPSGWIGWYQVALGLRVPLGPLFVGGEIAFEQYDIIRLGGGIGVGF